MGYPAGWLVCSTMSTIHYHHYKSRLGEKRLVEDKPKE
jgi:uncharacterized membrane protein